MFNRLSAFWLVLGVIGGYAVTGVPARAQNAAAAVPSFINPGDELALLSTTEKSEFGPCTVAETRGTWVRCAPVDKFANQPYQEWLNLDHVVRLRQRLK